jgi:uncharacterized protein YfdQ (DUF2303 family)
MTEYTEDKPGASYANAFETAIKAVTLAERSHIARDGREFVVVPDGFDLKDVTDPHRLPDFIRQTLTVDEPGSLSAYVNRFKRSESVLFADLDNAQVVARLDYHDQGVDIDGDAADVPPMPRQNKHVATLQLRETQEFQDWCEFCSDFWPQAEFANFLDENRIDVIDPDGGDLLEIVKDLQAVSTSSFTGKVDLTNGDVSIGFETDTKEVQKVMLPKTVTLRLAIYAGDEPVEIECALRWRAQSGGVKLALVMRRINRVKRELFAKIANDVAEATGLPVYFGRQGV